MFIFDTDLFSLLEWSEGEARQNLLRRMNEVPAENLATTIITYEEQTRGWMAFAARARTSAQQLNAYHKLQRHLEIYRVTQVLGFDQSAATEFERLQRLRLRIGTMDLKIAAIAFAHDATVLTRNRKDFDQIPGLNVEDWSV